MKTVTFVFAISLFSTASFGQSHVSAINAGTATVSPENANVHQSASATVQSGVPDRAATKLQKKSEEGREAVASTREGVSGNSAAAKSDLKNASSKEVAVSANSDTKSSAAVDPEGNKTEENSSLGVHATASSEGVKAAGNQVKEQAKTTVSTAASTTHRIVAATQAPVHVNTQVKAVTGISLK